MCESYDSCLSGVYAVGKSGESGKYFITGQNERLLRRNYSKYNHCGEHAGWGNNSGETCGDSLKSGTGESLGKQCGESPGKVWGKQGGKSKFWWGKWLTDKI